MSEMAPFVEETPQQEQPPAQEPPQAEAQGQQGQEPPQAPEEQDPTAGLSDAEAKLAALQNALTAARGELRNLKPLAQKAQQYEQYVSETRPYVEFLKANPQLLQPRQEPPQAQPEPKDDPTLVELARTLELYDPQTGQPDVKRAQVIRNLTRSEAESIAKQAIQPLQVTTYEQRAAANIQQVLATTKTADGQPIDQQYLGMAIQSIAQAMPREEAVRILADPQVMEVIKLTALGLQAAGRKSRPAAPTNPPLHIEAAGGVSPDVKLSDFSRRLARAVGKTDKEWAESGKKFNPNGANSLE